MEAKQSKISAFFINNENESETISYIKKNAPLLRGHVLIFSQAISLKLKSLCFTLKLCNTQNLSNLKKKSQKEINEEFVEKEDKQKKQPKKEIFRTIRSGETVLFDGDLIISGDINDGAKIIVKGTLIIFGTIKGDIICNGSYLIFSMYNRGKIIFNDKIINKLIKGDNLKMFYLEEKELKIKELN